MFLVDSRTEMGWSGLHTPASFDFPVVPKFSLVGSGSYPHQAWDLSLQKSVGLSLAIELSFSFLCIWMEVSLCLPAGPQCSTASDPVKVLWKNQWAPCLLGSFWFQSTCQLRHGCYQSSGSSLSSPSPLPTAGRALPALLPEMKAVTLFSLGKGYLSPSCDLLQPE